MADRSKMDHRTWSMSVEHAAQQLLVTDVAMNKLVAPIFTDRLKTAEIAGISQLVQVDDRGIFHFDPAMNKVRPDESCASGHDDRILHKKHSAFSTQHSAPELFFRRMDARKHCIP